jgi:hypothetical protein
MWKWYGGGVGTYAMAGIGLAIMAFGNYRVYRVSREIAEAHKNDSPN